MKKCTKCNKTKENSEFHNNKKSKDGLMHSCKECHKLSMRSVHYKRKYGITLDLYDKLLKQQNHCCSICNETDKNKELSVDHCHTTGNIRGLLCMSCNTALGKFKDSTELLNKAISYLNNPPYKDKDE